MWGRGIIQLIVGLIVFTCIAILGCSTLHKAGVPGFEQYAKVDHEALETERRHRENFAVHRDHKALYWLLANRISNGMRREEVEEILGEAGEFTTDFKGKDMDGARQATDSAYKWGPDSSGRSVVIWFRDGHVCNFQAKYYRET